VRVAFWTTLGATALLWPARAIGPFDGMPLDQSLEAILIGVAVPALWWFHRRTVTTRPAQTAIVALLAWKIGSGLLLTQQGLCLTTAASAPLNGINQGIPIVEPHGFLRSWDVRADWRAVQPECTAIVTRSLHSTEAFPAWFVNVTDQMLGRRDFTMRVRGVITLASPRQFELAVGEDMRVAGSIDHLRLADAPLRLEAGTHAVDLSMSLTGDRWRFAPTLDGRPLWNASLVTVASPNMLDRTLGAVAPYVSALLSAALIAVLMLPVVALYRVDAPILFATVALAGIAVIVAFLPGTLSRTAGAIAFAAVAVPVSTRLRNLRGAFLVVGLPWLAFFAARSLPQIGHFSVYSSDDWLTYQVAGYRIYMHGYWLEGGNAVFDFQPFYRWVTGALHLVFGDSSVGELYLDATCLLAGALLAFQLVRSRAGYRWGVAASAATLATFTLGTPWYFLGRGLSEIAAAGWAFLAMFFLLRSRRAGRRWVFAAGAAAILMFYTRLNHLIFAAFLPVFRMSIRVRASVAEVSRSLRQFGWRSAAMFLTIFGAGVLAFMARTWHYTGEFSLFLGTSLRHNDTGLRPWTLFDGEVWSKVGHSLAATVWMNEPPHPDPRALFVVLGTIVALAALLQLPVARWVPAVALVAFAGARAGAFLAHAHGYPGRFSIHIVPFACALTMSAAAQLGKRAA
jgi:hypothetical protein